MNRPIRSRRCRRPRSHRLLRHVLARDGQSRFAARHTESSALALAGRRASRQLPPLVAFALSACLVGEVGSRDGEPPSITGRFPAAADDNAWAFEPIVVTFSEPIVAAAEAVALTGDDGTALGNRVTVSEDGLTLVIERTGFERVTLIEVALSEAITDLAGVSLAAEAWAYSVPYWQEVDAGLDASPELSAWAPDVALDLEDSPIIAYLEGALEGAGADEPARLYVRQWSRSAWHPLGDSLNQDPARAASQPRIQVEPGGAPIVAWAEGMWGDLASWSVHVKRWDGVEWVALGVAQGDGQAHAAQPALTLDPSGAAVVSWRGGPPGGDAFHVRRWNGAEWLDLAPPLSPPGSLPAYHGPEVVIDPTGVPVVAWSDGRDSQPGVYVSAYDAAQARWVALGAGPLDADRANPARIPKITIDREGALFVTWEELVGPGSNVYVSRWDGTRWSRVGGAKDVDVLSTVRMPYISSGGRGGPMVAWSEQATGYDAQTALLSGAADEYAPALDLTLDNDAWVQGLVADRRGNPIVAWVECSPATSPQPCDVHVKRFNGSPSAPAGIDTLGLNTTCSFPLLAAPGFPTALSQTGCYTDLPGKELATGFIPYSLNSVLWSDGARKRRAIALPAGTTLGYQASGALGMPVGTILVKEFMLDRPADASIPLETRFLVKRQDTGAAGDWEGFTYKWRADGRDADLLDAATTADYDVGGQTHTHAFPSRGQCLTCHNPAAGFTLGPQAAQLSRRVSYRGVVDHQLRVFDHLELFGDPIPTPPTPMPSPLDATETTEARARAYLHANCAQCHRPGGPAPFLDLRFETPLGETNLCDPGFAPGTLRIAPGSPDASELLRRLSIRGAGQMPPLGSLQVDPLALAVVRTWIQGLAACPP